MQEAEIGKYQVLKVKTIMGDGVVMQAGSQAVFLPKEEVPQGIKAGEMLNVFLYHDVAGNIIATTKEGHITVGSNVSLRCVALHSTGAFLEWGLPKDLFIPKIKMKSKMEVGQSYMVHVYWDAFSERVAASEKEEDFYSNENHGLKYLDVVQLEVLKNTNIGYLCIINNKQIGLLHHNEVFKPLRLGETFTGFIKAIKEDGKIDVMTGMPGYQRVNSEAGKILSMLKENKGFLPYHDKTDAEEIYHVFGMSKKTFKMTVGNLFREKKIRILENGIELV